MKNESIVAPTQYIPSSIFVKIDSRKLEMISSEMFTLCFFMFHLLLSIMGVEISDQASRV